MSSTPSSVNDFTLFTLIEREKERQQRGVELIASENFVSPQVLQAMGSVLTNKYAEGLPGRRYYGGCEVVDAVEQLAIDRVKALFQANWANVQPHAGTQANTAIMLALLTPGDAILGFDLSHGGHLTHGSPVSFSGKLYKPSFYGVDRETGLIDYKNLEIQAHKARPKLIICGASAYSRDWDYARLRAVADDVGALLMADISHPAGLIACKLLNDPLPHCHIISTTTHKTLRGPRGGVLLMRDDMDNPMGIRTKKGKLRKLSSLLDSAVFPGTQGGPLEHVIAAKAVAFGEALTDDFQQYTKRVQANARALATALIKRGYMVVSGGTDNHIVLIDLHNKHITGKVAENTLGQADITINKNMVPFDDKSPLETSGMRLGTAAITTRGLQESDMDRLAGYIDKALDERENATSLTQLRHTINTWMGSYPLFA